MKEKKTEKRSYIEFKGDEEEETKTPKLKKLRRVTLNTGRCIHELELMRIIIKRQGWGVRELKIIGNIQEQL